MNDSENLTNDVEETLRLLKEIPALVSNVSDVVLDVRDKVKNGCLPTANGLSFLDLKNHLMLNYLMNLTHIVTLKLSGESLKSDPAIDRLVELRVVLEKMKPIEEKLKYQINKIESAVHGKIDSSDPLRLRPNPENLISEDEEHGEDDDDDEVKRKEAGVYVPPNISAAYFDEDEAREERQKKMMERSRKKALNSSVLQELKLEHSTKPEELKESVDPYRLKISEELNERERYEEEYMTRLPMTKKQRHEARQLATISNLDMKIGRISDFDFNTSNASVKRKSGGKKGSFSKSKKGYGKRKKR